MEEEDQEVLGNGMEMTGDLLPEAGNGNAAQKSFEEGYEPAGFKNEPKGYTKAFLFNRLLVFAGLVVGYSCFYITRNSFIYTAPVMVDAGAITMTQVR